MMSNKHRADVLREIDSLLTEALEAALRADESLLAALITEAQDATQRRFAEP